MQSELVLSLPRAITMTRLPVFYNAQQCSIDSKVTRTNAWRKKRRVFGVTVRRLESSSALQEIRANARNRPSGPYARSFASSCPIRFHGNGAAKMENCEFHRNDSQRGQNAGTKARNRTVSGLVTSLRIMRHEMSRITKFVT